MLSRRQALFIAVACSLAASTSNAAQPTVAVQLQSLLGEWKVSAVQEASASAERATIRQASESSVLLTFYGETAKVVGGVVELKRQESASIIGTSRTGVEVTLTPHSANRWNLSLRGSGLYFSLYLVK